MESNSIQERRKPTLGSRISLVLLVIYKKVFSPVFGLLSSCRYTPTCSQYAYTSIERFGWRQGWWLALRRIARCQPFGGYGYDPVPEHYITWREARSLKRKRKERKNPKDQKG